MQHKNTSLVWLARLLYKHQKRSFGNKIKNPCKYSLVRILLMPPGVSTVVPYNVQGPQHTHYWLDKRRDGRFFWAKPETTDKCAAHYVPINGMPHLAYLGQIWRKKGNLALESSPRGWYIVGIVKTSRKIHEQPWGLMTIVTTDLYTSSTQIAYIFSFIMLMCLWKIPQIPIHPCHTLYTRGRYGVLVRDM